MQSKKHHRVSAAILRNAGKDKSSSINGHKQAKAWSAAIAQLWAKLLRNEKINTANQEPAMHLLFAALRGLHDDINPYARLTKNSYANERKSLVKAVHFLLTQYQ